MTQRRPRLAKLTRPDAAGLLGRERLFATLDASLGAQFAWISGPAGAGKTSLVSTWLADRRLPGLWYRIDAMDRDPATFFHYLALAAESGRRRSRKLPHLTPEYLAGLRTFSRRFFREFFARMGAPFVIVFDNCHEAMPDSPIADILAWAVEEAPEGIAVVGVSRQDPGEPFARWMADTRFVHVDTNALRLTDVEARAIASTSGQEALAAVLCDEVDGWAAGFTLLLRARASPLAAPGGAGPGDALFDYFTGQVLARIEAQQRDFLLRTAVLQMITPSTAAELTGFPQAAELLSSLHRNHFFTERRSFAGTENVYEYHPLFRSFLLARLRDALGQEAFAEHCRQAARLLQGLGRDEDAVPLQRMAGDWTALAASICTLAPLLMGQGRWQTTKEWIDALPPAVIERQPWLLFWRGACRCMVDPGSARQDFEAAYTGFARAGETIGTLLACAGVLEAGYLAFGDQRPSIPWIDELDRLLGDVGTLPVDVEVRVIQSLMGAMMSRVEHPMLARWAARAVELLRDQPKTRGAAGLIAFASSYYLWAGDFAAVRNLIAHVPLDRSSIEAAPLSAVTLCIMQCGVSWQDVDHEAAMSVVQRARAIADDSGVHVLDAFITTQAIYIALSARDLPMAQRELSRLASLVSSERKLDFAHYGALRSGVLVLAGEIGEALEIIAEEADAVHALGASFPTAAFRIQLAQTLVLAGRPREALQPLNAALDFARAMPSRIQQFQSLLTLAWAQLRAGDPDASLDALRSALAIGRVHNYTNCHPLWIPEMMREVLGRALDAGIETEYVRGFIRHRRLAPSEHDAARWPWALRIHALGRFEILRDDAPLPSTGKAKRRILDLLKAIIAHGPQGASAEALAALLWPDAEGDGARDALRVAVHRLRKLLGDEHAIELGDGHIALSAQWCRVDAFVFERMVDAGQPATATAVLDLYRGHLLPADSDQPWLLSARERLRSKFLRAVDRAGAGLADTDVDAAIELYRRTIEIDPLAESAYRRLMECLARCDRRAEAIEAYRRCRQMLSVVLGTRPSADTEALAAAIRASGERGTG